MGDGRPVGVITGASSGIGAAIARRLRRRYRLVLLARREERLRALAEEIDGEYEVCDVSERDQVEATAHRVLARHADLALLVNNAGIPGRGSFTEVDAERIEAVIRTNYLGSVWCLRAFLPGLESAAESDLVNIVSIAGRVAFAPAGPYAASKHAQLAFSRAVTAELAPRGIRVHTVNPGLIETEGFPQRSVRSRFFRPAIVGPERVADHVAASLEHRRGETFVPGWYRLAALVGGLAPRLASGRASRPGYRRSTD